DRAARRGARDPPEGRPRPGPPRGAGDRGRPASVPVPALDDRGGEQGAAHAELFFLPEPDARWHADPRQPAHVPHRAAATLPPCPVPARTGVAVAADLRAPQLGRGARRRARAAPAPDGLQPSRHRHARGGAGRMMEWITQAGTLAAVRVARGHVVLGAMDDIDFLHPVRVGQIAILRAQVEYVGTSSLEVGVRVWAEDVATGARVVTLNSHLVFVKMGDDV